MPHAICLFHPPMCVLFRYREALDAALETSEPAIVASLIEELAARHGLDAAVGAADLPALGSSCWGACTMLSRSVSCTQTLMRLAAAS